MKTFILPALALLAFAMPAQAQPQTQETAPVAAVKIGAPAPDFTSIDSNAVTQSLSQYKGRTVVLEWTNPECPYVVKHYESGNMQALQKEATADNVVWLTIASSGEQKQGFLNMKDTNKYLEEKKSAPTARLLDSNGVIGKLYGAKTTPHMYVINAEGTLVYMGAIDSNDSPKPETIKDAKNYVREALKSIKEGKAIETTSTKPYGCSVKYAN